MTQFITGIAITLGIFTAAGLALRIAIAVFGLAHIIAEAQTNAE